MIKAHSTRQTICDVRALALVTHCPKGTKLVSNGLLSFNAPCCTALHSTVLHCTVLYCPELCYIVLHCIVVLSFTTLCCTILHCPILYCLALHCPELHSTALYCTALFVVYNSPLQIDQVFSPIQIKHGTMVKAT